MFFVVVVLVGVVALLLGSLVVDYSSYNSRPLVAAMLRGRGFS